MRVRAHTHIQLQASSQAKLRSLTGSPPNFSPAFFWKGIHVSLRSEGGISPLGDPTHILIPGGSNMVPFPLRKARLPASCSQALMFHRILCLLNIRGSRIEIQFKELWCLQTVFPQRWKKTGMLFLELGQKKLIFIVIQEKRKKSVYVFIYVLGGGDCWNRS